MGTADDSEVEEDDDADERSEPDREVAAQAEPVPEAAPAQAAPADDGRDRRLEAGCLYYLTRGDGYYLHESIEQLTTNKRFAWKGTAKNIEAVFKAKPQWRELDPERAP